LPRASRCRSVAIDARAACVENSTTPVDKETDMAKGNRDTRQRDDKDNRKNAGHGETMRSDSRGGERLHNDSAGRGSRDNSRREQGSDAPSRR
jgi:hypothetical protein